MVKSWKERMNGENRRVEKTRYRDAKFQYQLNVFDTTTTIPTTISNSTNLLRREEKEKEITLI